MNQCTSQIVSRLLWAALLVATLFGLHAKTLAAPVVFSSSNLGGGTVQFALALIDGASAANQVSVTSFSTDGTATLGTSVGDVSGSPATGILMQDGPGLTEVLVDVGGASYFGLVFDATGFGPLLGEFGDSFSVFLLDPGTGMSIVESSDPTGNDALLLYVIDGSPTGSLQVFNPVGTGLITWNAVFQPDGPPGTVDGPAGLGLALLVLAAGLLPRIMRSRVITRTGLAALLALSAGGSFAQVQDLTASVQVVRSGLVPNRTTGTVDAQVTVTNRSKHTFHGPLTLALESSTPANVALYNSHGRKPNGADFVELPLPTGTLAPGASTAVTVRLLAYGQGVGATEFSVHGIMMTPERTAVLVVEGAYGAGVLGPDEVPVGSGWQVSVDGVLRGLTNNASRLQIAVPTSARVVMVAQPPSGGGTAVLPALVAGSEIPIKVSVDDGKSIGAGSLVRLEQARLGVLSRSAPVVALRFFKDERAVRLTELSNVHLIDVLGRYTNLSALFTVQADGSVRANGPAFMQALMGKSGQLTLEVGGSDAEGQVHVSMVSFQLADYRVRVQLVAPPSNPTLSLSGVRITAELLNSDVRFVAQSDAAGYITLPDSPAGSLSFSGGTMANGILYAASGSGALNRDTLVRLTLRAPADVLANVPPIVLQLLSPSAPRGEARSTHLMDPVAPTAEEVAHRTDLQARAAEQARKADVASLAPTATSVSASAAAGTQNVIVQGTAQLAVPQGTRAITLTYNVFTFEYPQYVLAQSIYNDVWSVSVLSAGGGSLFEITRQINSQLTQQPVWRPDGSTGPIKQVIDVASLAQSGDTTVILRVTSVNIGDSLLATIVNATLDTSEPLVIASITRDANPATANDGSFYSVPRPAGTNLLQRTYDLTVTKPTGSAITGVRVQLLNSAGAPLQTVLGETAPGGAGVAIVSQSDTSAKLRVRVTHQSPASTVASQPPPTRDIGYRFTVKGTASDGSALEDEKDESGKRALWRIPDTIQRYGFRDPGGDDWAARGTYNWLVTNGGLLVAVDDVSGEHGRNIGHSTHGKGTDIDAYHFYRFPGAISGGQNETALTNNLIAAFGTLTVPPSAAATQARDRVASWITATRDGLTALAALNTVSRVIYCSGTAAQGLAAGWCSRLIRTGTATRTIIGPGGQPVQQTLEFGGSFANNKVTYRNDHNNHVHVTLDASAIGE